MKPILLMKHTLAYLVSEVNDKNIKATEMIEGFKAMNVVEKEKYLVLTDKIVTNETG